MSSLQKNMNNAKNENQKKKKKKKQNSKWTKQNMQRDAGMSNHKRAHSWKKYTANKFYA